MTAERTAEEWGRVAVSLPGWRWMPGMVASIGAVASRVDEIAHPWPDNVRSWPDPDDPATAGCLLSLLGRKLHIESGTYLVRVVIQQEAAANGLYPQSEQRTLGRACIAAAEALGRWPGGVG